MNNKVLLVDSHSVAIQALLMGAQLRELRRQQMQKTAIAIAGGERMFYLTVITLGRFEKLIRDQQLGLREALEQIINDGFLDQLIASKPKTETTKKIIH